MNPIILGILIPTKFWWAMPTLRVENKIGFLFFSNDDDDDE